MVLKSNVIVVAICLLAASRTASSSNQHCKLEPEPAGQSQETLQNLSNRIKHLVDFNANPCKDFYQYVCGRQTKIQKARGGLSDTGDLLVSWPDEPDELKWPFSAIDKPVGATEELKMRALQVLASNRRSFDESQLAAVNVSKLAEIYNSSCTKRDPIILDIQSRLGLALQMKIFLKKAGSQFGKTNWLDTHARLVMFLHKEHPKRLAFFSILIRQGTNEDPTPIVRIGHLFANHSLPVELKYLQPSEPTMKRLKLLSKGLIRVHERCVKRGYSMKDSQPKVDMMFVDELAELVAPGIDWHRLIANYFGLGELQPEQRVEITQVECVAEMARLLARYDKSESATTLSDWIVYKTSIDNILPARPVIDCDERTRTIFAPAFLPKLIAKLGGHKQRERIRMFSMKVVRAYERLIKLSRWPSWKLKADAIKKLHNMRINIGYYDAILERQSINRLYGQLKLDAGNFSLNQMIINQVWTKSISERDLTEYTQDHSRVNAYYSYTANAVSPLVELIVSTYNSTWPSYVNFGRLGMVIAHEVSHGFDKLGIFHTETGAKTGNQSMFGPDGRKMYEKRVNCLFDLYHNLQMPGTIRRSNGHVTFNENLADSTVLAAYYAYLDQGADFINNEPILEGFGEGFSRRKLFWISASQFWCRKSTMHSSSIYDDTKLISMKHSQHKWRANIAMMQLAEFRADFGCPAGDNLNKDCHLWWSQGSY